MRHFCAAWRFLTIFPLPGTMGGEKDDLADAAPYFPAVGLALGLFAWISGSLAEGVLPPLPAAVVVVAALALFSGGLHLDGLADTADGLLSARSREKALEIMRDSRIGVMGALALIFVVLLKVSCLASLSPGDLPVAALLMPVAGRVAMLPLMTFLPYARERGLGALFRAGGTFFGAVWPMGFLAAVYAAFRFDALAAGMLFWMTAVAAAGLLFKARLGGCTGDSYGATCELGELSAALAFACVS